MREVGSVVPALGEFYNDFPRRLAVETSLDGEAWQPAWEGSVRWETIEAALLDPVAMRVVVPFAPRPARYVRLRSLSQHDVWYWSIAELEIWSGADR